MIRRLWSRASVSVAASTAVLAAALLAPTTPAFAQAAPAAADP
ncbi:MAG TPA: TraB/GumN family protein, partial [Brevundimonas sp.]|nr:TraB/GumN family protein [Brevundimonas sp.]